MGQILIGTGLVLFLVAASLIDSEGVAWKIAVMLFIIALALMFTGLFFIDPEFKVEAEEPETEHIVQGAGVTAHMNAVLYNALHEPPELKLTNEEEIDLLARLITAETGGTDEYLAYLTGSVVINRMQSEKFPNTVFSVIYQNNPIQYQCTVDGHIYRPYTDLAWEVAEELLTYGTTIDGGVVFQSEFKQGSGVFRQVGRTYFCYD